MFDDFQLPVNYSRYIVLNKISPFYLLRVRYSKNTMTFSFNSYQYLIV